MPTVTFSYEQLDIMIKAYTNSAERQAKAIENSAERQARATEYSAQLALIQTIFSVYRVHDTTTPTDRLCELVINSYKKITEGHAKLTPSHVRTPQGSAYQQHADSSNNVQMGVMLPTSQVYSHHHNLSRPVPR